MTQPPDDLDDLLDSLAARDVEEAKAPAPPRPSPRPRLVPRVRRRRVRRRATTESIADIGRAISRQGLRPGGGELALDDDRPRVRGDCAAGERPCPWVRCKYHLYLDVNPETGSIKLNFPDLEVWDLPDTCALDVAGRGGITLEEVGDIMNLTRERIRQVEVRGLIKLKMGSPSPDELGAALLRREDDDT